VESKLKYIMEMLNNLGIGKHQKQKKIKKICDTSKMFSNE
jgi:hypothetical protein